MFNKKSFTLIEILIVGAIVSIIAGVATLNVTKNIGKGKDTQRLADLREIQTALETYKISFNTYPEAGTQGTDNYILNLASDFIKTLPKDSSGLHNGISGYIYNVTQDKKSYCFYIKDTVLEPNSQPDLVEPLIPNTWKICSGLEFANLAFNTISTSTSMCSNGASNYPLCNLCSPGYTYASSTCILSSCKNGAINPPLCNSCSAGYSLQDDGSCSKIIFILSPSAILSGQSSHMFWMAEQNASCKINNESVQFTGIKVVYPATTTAYTMECTVPNLPPQKKTVNLPVVPPMTAQIDLSQSLITAGATTTLSWNSTNSTYCMLGGSEKVATSGSRVLSPKFNTSYSLACYNSFGLQSNVSNTNVAVSCSYPTSTQFSTTGSYPTAITIDSAGNIYTANSGSNNVTKITPAGLSTILGTTGSGPFAITIDSAGNIYTANYYSNNVTKITPAGVSTTLGTTGSSPQAITIDSAGNIYTANSGSNNVTKITPAGVSTILGTTGAGPRSIIMDNIGNFYILNGSQNNVTKITPAGVSSIFGTTGGYPYSSVIDNSGNIYISNVNSHNVTKITPAGISTTLGTTGSSPRAITIDSAGNIYTANSGSNNVTKITPAGVSTILGSTGSYPTAITIDSAGNIYIANYNSNNVTKFTCVR